MRIDKVTARRYVIFAVIAVVLFSVLTGRLYYLQVVNAGQFQEAATNDRFKTIRLTGKRGMITDSESVVLAMSEDIYNVTFLMTNSQLTASNYKKFTPSILETKRIVESFGGTLKSDFVIKRDPVTTEWTFDFGKGISDKARAIRETQWRGNHYLSMTNYPTAQSCYESLFKLYQLDPGTDEATALTVMAVYSQMRMSIFNSLPIVIAQDVPF